MEPLFRPEGELAYRASINYDRMESRRFEPGATDSEGFGIFEPATYAWPGDMEGRAILAWILLQRMTGRPSKWLDMAMNKLGEFSNADGYFGPVASPHLHDEQQLAGHGWVLRALCEYWLETKDPATLDRLRTVVEALVLPTAGAHASYPIDPSLRNINLGSYIGVESEIIGEWALSSDIGCVFIFLDGVTQAAIVLEDPRLAEIVRELIQRMTEVDIVGVQVQTHAILTGCRAMIRWADHTSDTQLLLRANAIFNLYATSAASETHENWNWFGRPTHSEVCAIVDSLMIACQLWERTRNPLMLELAQLIYHNGLGHTQRKHGGYGCDTVVGGSGDDPTALRVLVDEAWWCCTMRASEGLASAAHYSVAVDGDGIAIQLPFSGTFRTHEESRTWQIQTDYPRSGSVKIHLTEGDPIELSLSVFAPAWMDLTTVELNGYKVSATRTLEGFVKTHQSLAVGDFVEFAFDLDIRLVPPTNNATPSTYRKVARGPLYYGLEGDATGDVQLGDLSWDSESATIHDIARGLRFTPIDDVYRRSLPETYRRQVLFVPRN